SLERSHRACWPESALEIPAKRSEARSSLLLAHPGSGSGPDGLPSAVASAFMSSRASVRFRRLFTSLDFIGLFPLLSHGCRAAMFAHVGSVSGWSPVSTLRQWKLACPHSDLGS